MPYFKLENKGYIGYIRTVIADVQCDLFCPAVTCRLDCVQEEEVTLSNLVDS